MHEKKGLAYAESLFKHSIALKQKIVEEGRLSIICEMAERLYDAFKAGGKLMVCGNGGSAADAQHIATELVVRLRPQVNRQALPAIALALDTSMITACGNDYGFEHVYERAVHALGQPNDILLGITTSGRSPNILLALKAAQSKGITTFGFLGEGGGQALAHCDKAFVVPEAEIGRIQEAHITAGHVLLELVEELLLAESPLQKNTLLEPS